MLSSEFPLTYMFLRNLINIALSMVGCLGIDIICKIINHNHFNKKINPMIIKKIIPKSCVHLCKHQKEFYNKVESKFIHSDATSALPIFQTVMSLH